MDFIKAQNLISKINNLFQSIQMSENQISTLEKDLMKSYLRELYEIIQRPDEPKSSSIPKKINNQKEELITDLRSNNRLESFDDRLDESIEEVKNELKSTVPSSSPAPVEPISKEEVISSAPVINQETIVKDYKTEQSPPTLSPSATSSPPPSATPSPVFNLSSEMAELFSEPSVSDLSDKLSGTPIQDLSRAFGVNERILTINELFGGDSNRFNETIRSINSLSSFHEAKSYLVNKVANEMNWTDESRKEKASIFIKTVRRKFK